LPSGHQPSLYSSASSMLFRNILLPALAAGSNALHALHRCAMASHAPSSTAKGRAALTMLHASQRRRMLAMHAAGGAEGQEDMDSFADTALYPQPARADSGMLQVSSLHTVSYETYGNPAGKPVLFVHGGPGGGTAPMNARYFDPDAYRIILVDQRGCGKSKPFAELEENTTWDLVADFEKVCSQSAGSVKLTAIENTHTLRCRPRYNVGRMHHLCSHRSVSSSASSAGWSLAVAGVARSL
jgi:hypothetical protein